MTGFIAQTAGGENPVGSVDYNKLFAVGAAAVRDHPDHQPDQHLDRPSLPAGLLMSTLLAHPRGAGPTVLSTTGRSKDRSLASLVFLGALWFSLFFGVMVLLVLIVDTAITGVAAARPQTCSRSTSRWPRPGGDRLPGRHPRHLVADDQHGRSSRSRSASRRRSTSRSSPTPNKWYNRIIEVNLQNLAAVPSIIYGMLAVAVMALLGLRAQEHRARRRDRAGPADPAGHHHHHPRGGPRRTPRHPARLPRARRDGVADQLAADPALGRPRASPPARSSGSPGPSARPRRCCCSAWATVRFDPAGFLDSVTALPIQIYSLTSQSREEFQIAASAGIIVLLVMILGLNALAIVIRNKFQKAW